MLSQSEIRASNAEVTSSTTPRVAAFVGATDGIGKAALQQLVSTGFPLKAYIVGRSEATFRPTLDELRRLNKSAELLFIEGQVSLLSDTKRIIDEIVSRERSIDLLFLSAGFLPVRGHEATPEGLELVFAVGYYSRHLFAQRLLPLLNNAAAAFSSSSPAYRPRILNIMGTGVESKDLFLTDLDLQQPDHLTLPHFIGHMSSRTSVTLRRLAESQKPTPSNGGRDAVVMHVHPGIVATDVQRKSWGDRWTEDKAMSFPEFVYTTPQESGERMLYLMTSAKYGGEGVPLGEGQAKGLTVRGEADGSLFCVGDDMETLDLGGILDELESTGAGDVIWEKFEEVIGKFV